VKTIQKEEEKKERDRKGTRKLKVRNRAEGNVFLTSSSSSNMAIPLASCSTPDTTRNVSTFHRISIQSNPLLLKPTNSRCHTLSFSLSFSHRKLKNQDKPLFPERERSSGGGREEGRGGREGDREGEGWEESRRGGWGEGG
jgi:hypothetical protein